MRPSEEWSMTDAGRCGVRPGMQENRVPECAVFGDRSPVQVEYASTALDRRFMGILDEARRPQEDVDKGGVSKDGDWRHDEQ